ncbi:MAG: 23S rRNA (uracil(1939)-C(5))-methyltransferase RlmD [Planctomycetota bacterium]|nr:23S rRNA (uracil(1939)-C(5))-methyltransferase RlmD [Planctomycetota bacterium]
MHCEHFQSHYCRSCSLLDNTYEAALAQKQSVLAQLFPNVLILPFVPCSQIPGSRIRAKLGVTGTNEQPQIGFYDDQQTIVAVNDCPLHHPLINEWTLRLPTIIREARLAPYDVQADRGELKFVVITCSPTHQQLMIQFVLRSREAVDRIRSLWRRMSEVEKQSNPVISINLQPMRSSSITGTEEIPVSEQTSLPIRFGTTELLFGPRSFLQTNYEVAAALYDSAARILAEQAAEKVLDLYCGAGAFALTAGADVRSVVGIDVSAHAIANATEAAVRNNRTNAQFRCRSLAAITTDRLAETEFDSIICNPPRRGLDAASIALIQTLRPQWLLYSSCNASTLQRDIQFLTTHYEIEHLQPFDMFPFTNHFEVLSLLRRRN